MIKATTIILGAGMSSRMKSYEPRSLIKLKNGLLIEHQVKTLREKYDGDIILVTGYKTSKVTKKTKNLDVKIVENTNYQETGSFESLRLGLKATNADTIFVCHGDLYFDVETLDNIHNESFIVKDTYGQIPSREVGFIEHNGYVTNLSYGLPNKWGQMLYLVNNELSTLREICLRENKKFERKLLFEGINYLIDHGGRLAVKESPGSRIVEIDTIGDLKNENLNS